MNYSYPCLYDYMKEDLSLIGLVSNLFEEIANESGVILQDYDNELFSELGNQYYYETAKRPLKVLYYKYIENGAVDFEDSISVENFFKHIGKVAYSRFGHNWERIYRAYFATPYKPLENYDMEQVRTPLLDTTNTTTRKQETEVKTNGKTSVVPFNSTNPTLTGESEGDSTTTEDKTKNEVEASVQERGTDTLTRHGNIGVTTSQQMLQSELDLRKLDFIKRICRDVDKIILRDYLPCESFWPL